MLVFNLKFSVEWVLNSEKLSARFYNDNLFLILQTNVADCCQLVIMIEQEISS